MGNRLTNMDMPANRRAAKEAGTTMEVTRNFMEARKIPGMIANIKDSGHRISEIVSNMLTFAQNGEAKISSHDLPKLLDKTLKLAASDFNLKKHYEFRMIEIIKEYKNNIPPVPCEGVKIQQVVLNILQNIVQAMLEAGTEKPAFTLRTSFKEDQRMAYMEIEGEGTTLCSPMTDPALSPCPSRYIELKLQICHFQ